MNTVTVGSRYQVVIPSEVRKKLPVSPHSKMNIELRNRCIVLYPVTAADWRGVGKELADGTDATDYVRALRAEWSRQT